MQRRVWLSSKQRFSIWCETSSVLHVFSWGPKCYYLSHSARPSEKKTEWDALVLQGSGRGSAAAEPLFQMGCSRFQRREVLLHISIFAAQQVASHAFSACDFSCWQTWTFNAGGRNGMDASAFSKSLGRISSFCWSSPLSPALLGIDDHNIVVCNTIF